jgi:hypothetical protein
LQFGLLEALNAECKEGDFSGILVGILVNGIDGGSKEKSSIFTIFTAVPIERTVIDF